MLLLSTHQLGSKLTTRNLFWRWIFCWTCFFWFYFITFFTMSTNSLFSYQLGEGGVAELMRKFFKNYSNWCKFLERKSNIRYVNWSNSPVTLENFYFICSYD